jgi:hypothetical protein
MADTMADKQDPLAELAKLLGVEHVPRPDPDASGNVQPLGDILEDGITVLALQACTRAMLEKVLGIQPR